MDSQQLLGDERKLFRDFKVLEKEIAEQKHALTLGWLIGSLSGRRGNRPLRYGVEA